MATESKYALVLERNDIIHQGKIDCRRYNYDGFDDILENLNIIKTPVSKSILGLPFKKGSSLKKKLERDIVWFIESGLLAYWEKNAIDNMKSFGGSLKLKTTKISQEKFGSNFKWNGVHLIVYCIGIFISIVSFFLELSVWHLYHKNVFNQFSH